MSNVKIGHSSKFTFTDLTLSQSEQILYDCMLQSHRNIFIMSRIVDGDLTSACAQNQESLNIE